jgi:hypothetical protein
VHALCPPPFEHHSVEIPQRGFYSRISLTRCWAKLPRQKRCRIKAANLRSATNATSIEPFLKYEQATVEAIQIASQWKTAPALLSQECLDLQAETFARQDPEQFAEVILDD